MRRLLLVLAAVCVAATASAQFKLTPGGFVNATEPTKKYIVVSAPEMDKGEIFNAVISYLEDNFNYGCCRIDNSGNDILTFSMDCPSRNDHTMACPNGIYSDVKDRAFVHNFSITFRFKDEKLRVDTPQLTGFVIPIGKRYYHASFYNPTRKSNRNLFKATGEPARNREGLIAGLENYFNTIVNGVLTSTDDNDW